jgi:hypothetical protein
MGAMRVLRALSVVSFLAAPPLMAQDGSRTKQDNVSQDASSPQFLPYGDGQKWKEYDLSDYTSQLTDVPKPEQAIVDWILRETGTEIWFSEPLGFMSASRQTLRVYHVPAVQDRVQEVVARFVDNPSDQYVMGVRLITVSNPNWRASGLHLLRSVPVQSPGVDAWLITKETPPRSWPNCENAPIFKSTVHPTWWSTTANPKRSNDAPLGPTCARSTCEKTVGPATSWKRVASTRAIRCC